MQHVPKVTERDRHFRKPSVSTTLILRGVWRFVACAPLPQSSPEDTKERLCRLAKPGAMGAGKTLVTDYRFAGPGCATRKPIGWGKPQTPLLARGASA